MKLIPRMSVLALVLALAACNDRDDRVPPSTPPPGATPPPPAHPAPGKPPQAGHVDYQVQER